MGTWSARVGRVLAASRVALVLALLPLGGCTGLGHHFRHLLGDRQVQLADDVVIERDEWGVPHVHGRTDAAAAFGVAYAMAEDNYWQLEEAYIQDLGLASYWYGERYLADDLVRAGFEVEAQARAEFAAAGEQVQELLLGFTEGLNYYLRRHPQEPRRVIGRYEPWMVLARAREVSAATLPGASPARAMAELHGVSGAGARPAPPARGGAALAVAPARGGGRALLLAGVQRAFFGSEQPYELEVESEAGWHVYGLARLGTPVPYAGHNQSLGWAHAAGGDSAAVTRLLFAHPTDSLAYRNGSGWERASTWVDTVLVNGAAGVEARQFRFLRTPHGPVVARRGDTAWAVLLPRLRAGRIQQWLELGRAKSLAEFTAALERGALPEQVTVYADVEGNILRHPGGGGAPEVNPSAGLVSAGVDESLVAALADSAGSVAFLERLALGQSPLGVTAEIGQLVHEWEQVGGRESRRAFALDTAVERLRRWNGATGASVAATLYYYWRAESPDSAAALTGDSRQPLPFPRFRALERAKARLLAEWGTDSVAWGDVIRLQRRHSSGEEGFSEAAPGVAVSGLPDGSLFVLTTARGTARRQYAVGGTAAVLLTELTSPPRTRSVVVFGQSAAATSPHHFDQAARYAAGTLKDAWFGDARATRVRERYHPGERARVLQGETPVQ